MPSWKTAYQNEITLAAAARQRNNEGQARVYARRAAGIIIQAYYQQRQIALPPLSAYDLLKMLMDDETQPQAIRQSAAYLTLRVNEQFKLPAGLDLIKEAETLAAALLPPL
jgi:hypothetical protein